MESFELKLGRAPGLAQGPGLKVELAVNKGKAQARRLILRVYRD